MLIPNVLKFLNSSQFKKKILEKFPKKILNLEITFWENLIYKLKNQSFKYFTTSSCIP